MAYTHSKYNVMMTTTAGSPNISMLATGDLAHWSPGGIPHIIRMVGVEFTASGMNTGGNASFACIFNHLDTTSGSTASAIGTLNGVSTDKAGHVLYYVVTGTVVVKPGEEVVFNVSAVTTATAGTCRPFLYVEPTWEQPANNAAMRATT